MRTNIVLDDELVENARKYSGERTKKGLVEEALQFFVQVKRQAGIKELRGKLHWEGDLDELRRGRFQDDRG
jgi:Arc/MetJ family transcription regulator